MIETNHIEYLKSLVDENGWKENNGDDLSQWLLDSRGRIEGKTSLILFPSNTESVSKIMTYCHEHRIVVVPQGGNTSRVGGATPDQSGNSIIICLSRMNNIRVIDKENYSMIVEAGTILQTIQSKAEDSDRLFPLSLGAEGSCMIGGNLASNAGGINVLRYGNTRDLVLGIEAVMPNGEIWNGLRSLRKDNTGYDLKHLLIGSEGTLGIITAASLRLFPLPKERATAFCALSDLDSCLKLLAIARELSGDSVSSFELIPDIALDMACEHIDNTRLPYAEGPAPEWSVLLEISGFTKDQMQTTMESLLETAFEEGIIMDASIAQNDTQRTDFWGMREAIVEAQVREAASIKHDIAVPVSSVPTFIRKAGEAVKEICEGIRPYPFGHVGDGNIHYNLSQPKDMDKVAFLEKEEDLHKAVHDVVANLNGSFSAEHGVGQIKTEEMKSYKSSVELALMKQIKQAFDPNNIMNPGKILS
ncbi:FAD-binding oxidoreductase [Curvivirga sp.]|uniref:FAD-binding oxidoreductase n=1 Tax=Curvivirga sp. TaxID=2856848 RepID=UPI003B5AD817